MPRAKSKLNGNGKLRLVYVDPATVRDNPLNWRKHPQKQSDYLSAIYNEVGDAGAAVINERDAAHGWKGKDLGLVFVDGHLRKQLKIARGEKLPAVIGHWTPAQEKKIIGSYDLITGLADYDADILRQITDGDELLKQLANEQEQLRALLQEPPRQEAQDPSELIDRAAELQKKWQAKRGDIWEIGKHRLMCGDSTNADDVAKLMQREMLDTLVSDPPYGIGYEYASHDDSSNEENEELIIKAFSFAPKSKVWTCGLMNLSRDLLRNPDAKILVWHKGFAAAGNGLGGASTWVPVLVSGVKDGHLPNDYLDFSTDRVPGLRELHTCPKPIALFAHLISCLAGKTVYEPFVGSGTTLVACEQTGRIGRGIEIEPKYCAVTLERLSLLGLEPKRIDHAEP